MLCYNITNFTSKCFKFNIILVQLDTPVEEAYDSVYVMNTEKQKM